MHAGNIGHTLLSNTPASWPSQDLILVTDTASNFMQVSPSSSIILGIRPDEMIGHSAVDFIHPEDLEIARQEMRGG
jgi:PAS domain S-box-containing protein